MLAPSQALGALGFVGRESRMLVAGAREAGQRGRVPWAEFASGARIKPRGRAAVAAARRREGTPCHSLYAWP